MRGLCVCCTVAAVVFCVHGLHRSLPLPSKSGILKCPTNATTMYAREYRARVVWCVHGFTCLCFLLLQRPHHLLGWVRRRNGGWRVGEVLGE